MDLVLFIVLSLKAPGEEVCLPGREGCREEVIPSSEHGDINGINLVGTPIRRNTVLANANHIIIVIIKPGMSPNRNISIGIIEVHVHSS